MTRRQDAKATQEPATLQLGKGGVTPTWLRELHDQAERRVTVKVRLLASARGDKEMKELAASLAEGAGVRLVDVRGFTATFRRRRK